MADNVESNKTLQVPDIVFPKDIKFIDENPDVSESSRHRIIRNDVRHSSLRTKSSKDKKRLCRHHSDSESKVSRSQSRRLPSSRRKISDSTTSSSSRKIKRSASAVEHTCSRSKIRTKVKRSISERRSVGANLHLGVPNCQAVHKGDNSTVFDNSESHSSRCSRASSASRTVVSNASWTQVVAFELGITDVPGLTPKEARRKRVVFTVAIVTITLLIVSILLVAITLLLSPVVDAVLRKENEEIYRAMSSGPSTAAPVPEGSTVGAANVTGSDHTG